MPNLIRSYVRFTDRISDYVGYLAAALIFVMGATLLLDAVTRNVINMPLHWCVELRSSRSPPTTSWAGAMTLKDDDHVRMDLIYARLSERGKARIDAVTICCLLFYLGRAALRLDLQPAATPSRPTSGASRCGTRR